MGRWSQRRRRGGGPSDAPAPPPPLAQVVSVQDDTGGNYHWEFDEPVTLLGPLVDSLQIDDGAGGWLVSLGATQAGPTGLNMFYASAGMTMWQVPAGTIGDTDPGVDFPQAGMILGPP